MFCETRLQAVDKAFGSVQALDGLDLVLPHGAITVLLGPNGAGKTTATRLITGALIPDAGSVQVFGLDPAGPDGEDVRRACGIVSAKPSLYDRLNGFDNLLYAAELYGLGPRRKARSRILEAAERFGIHHDLDQQVGGYSTGMKTRLALARAVLHEPQLLLLDEPTSGLDPESSVAVLAMVREMTANGSTVMMCTHLLLEAEGLADQIIILQDGTNLTDGKPAELVDRFWPKQTATITALRGSELDRIATWDQVSAYRREGQTATVELESLDHLSDLIINLSNDGIRLGAVIPFQPSLEDIYFAVLADDASPPGRRDLGRPTAPATTAPASRAAPVAVPR